MSLGEDQPRDTAQPGGPVLPGPAQPAEPLPPSAAAGSPRRTVQLPQTADRFAFHAAALTTGLLHG